MRLVRRFILSLTLCVVSLLVAAAAEAAPATKIYAGVYLHDVTKFEQRDGVFDVDMELWAKWLGEFDASRLAIANASEIERELLGEEQDGDWHSVRWRVKGTLRGEFPVHRFPFDRQTLAVVLELPEQYGELVPDLAGSGMRERFSITGWLYEPAFAPRVGEEIYHSDLGAIANEGRRTKVRRAAFEVTLHRPFLTGATKLFLPLLVILLVAVVALFVNPKELEVRASVGVTALLACFAFQFAVSDTLPNVSYITLADLLFLVSYGLTAALLAVSIAAFWLHERERHAAWRKLDKYALIAFPIILFVAVLLAFPFSKEAHADAAVTHDSPRPPSARPLLRIGTNNLDRPSGGLVSRGAQWSTTRTNPDGTTYPVLVTEVPAITNDALRFLADGRLEVNWKLLPGLKWSDGSPLTAEDLKFALEVSPDPRIDDTRMVDPLHLVVRFKERVAVALEAITPLPRHALEKVYASGGYEAVRDYRTKSPIPSLGPYRIASFEAQKELILEANPNFNGPPPSIARIEIRYFPSDAELVAAFVKGDIDMIAPNAITPEAAQELAKTQPDAVNIRESEVLLYLQPDLSQPQLGKLEVRRALLMALDRDRMRNEVFDGSASFAPIAHVPIPGAPAAGSTSVPCDPEAAKLELERLGAAGLRLPLVHSPMPLERAVAAIVARDLAAVGVTVDLREDKDIRAVMRKRNHGGFVLATSTGERADQPEKYWNIPQIEGKYDPKFRSDAYDDAIAELVEREGRALYPERREQIRDLIFAAYSRKLPNLPLLFIADRMVVQPALDGWEIGTGSKFATTLERWHFVEPGSEK